MNNIMLAPYSREEVKKTLFNIGHLKALKPDGLHTIFYLLAYYWRMYLAVNSGIIHEGWNDMTIVLIPKVENPEFFTQFRHISLCNVIYKVISKLTANRPNNLLSDIISLAQSVFVVCTGQAH
jgi:hypothetical protein